MTSYIFVKPGNHNHNSRDDYYWQNSFTIYRYRFNYYKGYAIFRYSYIYLLNSNQDYYFLPSRYIDSSPLLVYIIYLITIAYTSLLKYRTILSLKLVAEALFSIEINIVAHNRLCLNRIEFQSIFQLLGELLLRGSQFIVLCSYLHSIIIHYLLRGPFPSINRM